MEENKKPPQGEEVQKLIDAVRSLKKHQRQLFNSVSLLATAVRVFGLRYTKK